MGSTTQPRPGARQPWLHRLELAVDGPVTVLAAPDGQIGSGADAGGQATGVFVDDRRVVSMLRVRLDDEEPTMVAASSLGARSDHWLAARHLGPSTPDATVEVHRRRTLDGSRPGLQEVLTERIVLTSRATDPVTTRVYLHVAGDGADVVAVKTGRPPGAARPITADRMAGGDEAVLSWSDERHTTTVALHPGPAQVWGTATEGTLVSWAVRLAQGESWTLTLRVSVRRLSATALDADAASGLVDWDADALAGAVTEQQLARTVWASLTDLRHLTLTDPDQPSDFFVAAGSPWYLTLFGRDSLWAARFMLPFSQRLALGTLRALARRQADHHDPEAAAEPGKILHEVRRAPYVGGTMHLPTRYYGTVDATPLWVVLLHETWQTGGVEGQVRELLPALRAALGWLQDALDRSGDGLLRYVDETGHGLSNQGWKDSGDSMRRADGSVAPAPIALLEAQAYAVQAARGAADLLDALDGGGGRPWRTWADALAERVRDRFWVGRDGGRYLAMALDADGAQVDGIGSNMGHTLGTGLLTGQEAGEVVHRLMAADLLRTFGIGTLSRDNPAYNPIGYHTGSVWTHDTAIAIRGMWLEGYRDEARNVAERLIRLAAVNGWRFPELCGAEPVGDTRGGGGWSVPYPAACRPQGWSAASAAVLLQVLG